MVRTRIKGNEKKEVKRLYSAIVLQALSDINDLNDGPKMWEEINKFLLSDYGQCMLDVSGITYQNIDDKYKLSEKVKMYKDFMRAYEIGLKDVDLARHLQWDVDKVIYLRRRLDLPEYGTKKFPKKVTKCP